MVREIRRVEVPQEFSAAILSDNTIILIIDVYMFSSTVITLHSQGVKQVVPAYDTNSIQQYKKNGIMVGGESQADFDFSNSPQNIYATFGMMNDVPNRVALTSNNGAKRAIEAIEAIEEDNIENSHVMIASSINASATAEYINENWPNHSVLLLCAGSNGEATIEDVIGSLAISQSIRNEDIPIEEYEEILSMLPAGQMGKNNSYDWLSDEDVHHISTIDEFPIISKYNYNTNSFESERQ